MKPVYTSVKRLYSQMEILVSMGTSNTLKNMRILYKERPLTILTAVKKREER